MNEGAPDYPVSQDFFRLILDTCPVLKHRPDYRFLLGHILYGTWTDAHSGELIIPGSLLSAMQGKAKAYRQNNYRGLSLLEQFSSDVFVVRWRSHDLYKELARRIISTEVAPAIAKASTDDLKVAPEIWLGSGQQLDRRTAERERRRILRELENSPIQPKCAEARLVLDYLNNQSSTSFSRACSRNFHLARTVIETLRPSEKEREYRLLRAIQRQPQPFYKAVRGSSRLYPENPSLLNLKRDVRKALTSGWIDVDLKGAQLAIISEIWDCPETRTLIVSGKPIWEELARQTGIAYSISLKLSIKELIYRAAFGCSEKNLKAEGYRSIGKDATDRLVGGQIFLELLCKRSQAMKKIRKNGFVTDAFGNQLKYDEDAKNHLVEENRQWGQTSNLLSLLAEQAQSYELKILYPVFELASQFEKSDRHCFDIRTLLYDGFTFTCRDSRDIHSSKVLLKRLVKEQAENLGIPTELEIG